MQPSTSPCLCFQRKQIWYLSHLFSWEYTRSSERTSQIVQSIQCRYIDLRQELSLDSLQLVDIELVPGGRQPATVVQPGLDQGAQDGKHQLVTPSPKGPEGPSCHSTAGHDHHVNLQIEGQVSSYVAFRQFLRLNFIHYHSY